MLLNQNSEPFDKSIAKNTGKPDDFPKRTKISVKGYGLLRKT